MKWTPETNKGPTGACLLGHWLRRYAVQQSRVCIDFGMGFHTVAPLIPLLVWRISGSRVLVLFLVDGGAAIGVPSMTAPCLSDLPPSAMPTQRRKSRLKVNRSL
jgi:hypothetical protein